MIGYPCTQEIIVSDAFSSIVNEITIVKDNNGNVYMPEFGFNGIGFLEGGQGYQIKMTDFVLSFTFCQSIQFPTIEGCTDCEASNFSKLATTDDGSCIYDSDGDGIDDVDEILGCQDLNACNYDYMATDVGQCNYAEEGYNCDGSIIPYVGLEAFGGIIFYIDETGQHGLVAALEDLEGTSGIYEWGCIYTNILGADGQNIGTGYQNTLDIVGGCSQISIAASEALAYELEGYNDWYLPSLNELQEMYSTIGIDWAEGNSGGFETNWYWSSSEQSDTKAWLVYFDDGSTHTDHKYSTGGVRVIRSF
tara:strand:- start:3558 stop:4475 length:918 start_codon:yes stop_codon:yes gene_type:complete